MKKLIAFLAIIMLLPVGVQAYNVTVTDPAGDQIGVAGFDTTQISYNVNTNPLVVNILTNYTQAGILVGTWQTKPADLILWGSESSPPALAIPLVSHDGFNAGTLYNVASWYTSDDIAALNGITSPSYSWGFGQDVWIKTGSSTGFSGTVTWGATGVNYTASGWYWTDALPLPNPPLDYLKISWATSTCANDVVNVPEPATMLLLGFGLIGLAVGGARRFVK